MKKRFLLLKLIQVYWIDMDSWFEKGIVGF